MQWKKEGEEEEKGDDLGYDETLQRTGKKSIVN